MLWIENWYLPRLSGLLQIVKYWKLEPVLRSCSVHLASPLMMLKIISIFPNARKCKLCNTNKWSFPTIPPLQHSVPLAHYLDVDFPGFQASAWQERKPGEVGLGQSKWDLGKHEAGQGSVFCVPPCPSARAQTLNSDSRI